tara:strand:+ start:2285 stop:3628 length:1344 start_codon:yes stop_codon:yes gene_type:complete
MRTLRRPMFKIGGKAKSGNDGIMNGLVDRDQRAGGGNIGGGTMAGSNLGTRSGFAIINEFGQPYEPTSTGSSTSTTSSRLPVKNVKTSIFSGKNLPTGPQSSRIMELFKRFPKSAAISGFGLGAGAGTAAGVLADFYQQGTKTPLAYEKLKEVSSRPYYFDETNLDFEEGLKEIEAADKIGVAPGFFPRGGPEKFYKDRNLDPKTGLPKVDIEITEDNGAKKDDDDINKILDSDLKIDKTETIKEKRSRLEARAAEFNKLLNPDAREKAINKGLAAASTAFGKSTGDTKQDIANAITAAAGATSALKDDKKIGTKLAIEEDIKKGIASANYRPNQTQSSIDFYKSLKDDKGNRLYSDTQIAKLIGRAGDTTSFEYFTSQGLNSDKASRRTMLKKYPGIKTMSQDEAKKLLKNPDKIPNGEYYVGLPEDKFFKVENGKVSPVDKDGIL